MAYDSSKETITELALVDKNDRGDKIKVSHITVKGKAGDFADIRLMYTPEGASEVRPTQKGVRFSTEILPEIVTALIPMLSAEEAEALKEVIERTFPE